MEVLNEVYQITNHFIDEFNDEIHFIEQVILSDELLVITINLEDDTAIQVVQKTVDDVMAFSIRFDGDTEPSNSTLDNITRIRKICEDFNLEFVPEDEPEA